VVGDFARGIDNNIIDLVFVGNDINKEYLVKLVDKAEGFISRKIRYLVYGRDEAETFYQSQKEEDLLVLWKNGN
jgi:hypothetical protein